MCCISNSYTFQILSSVLYSMYYFGEEDTSDSIMCCHRHSSFQEECSEMQKTCSVFLLSQAFGLPVTRQTSTQIKFLKTNVDIKKQAFFNTAPDARRIFPF